jgi:glyoxylate/hydroxypyruvate reductase A
MSIAIVFVEAYDESPEIFGEMLAPMLPGEVIRCASVLPGEDVRCTPDLEPVEDIEFLICDGLPPGLAARLPNLKIVQKLGAGVDAIINAPDLSSNIGVARLKSHAVPQEISEYCLLHVLRERRLLRQYADNQGKRLWKPYPLSIAAEVTVGILGLGHNGACIARSFASLGFRTIGWSKKEKSLPGVTGHTGEQGLKAVLEQSDYVICALPSTVETVGLLNADSFQHFKPHSMLINVGRGDLIVDDDLIEALRLNRPAHAVLDVFHDLQLREDHPFWGNPDVTVTPHVAGYNVVDSLSDVADNFRRMKAGEPLLHEISREMGY